MSLHCRLEKNRIENSASLATLIQVAPRKKSQAKKAEEAVKRFGSNVYSEKKELNRTCRLDRMNLEGFISNPRSKEWDDFKATWNAVKQCLCRRKMLDESDLVSHKSVLDEKTRVIYSGGKVGETDDC